MFLFKTFYLGLFYHSISKEIQYDMAIQEVHKLNSIPKQSPKGKPNVNESNTHNGNLNQPGNDLVSGPANNIVSNTGRSNEASEESNAILNTSQQIQGKYF